MKQKGLIAILSFLIATSLSGQNPPQFNIVRPSTTGVPGEEVRTIAFDPAGNLWVAGRQTFFGESALGMLSADQLDFLPLPGGGFDTGAWKVWSSVHHPIPSPYLFSLVFTSDGTAWVATEGGLVRFRPNAVPPEEMWHTYTPANSPLVMPEVLSLAVDSQDNLWVSNESSIQWGQGQLFKLNTHTGQWTQINNGQHPWSVRVGNNDHVFITMTSSGGVMEFNGTNWVLHAGNAPALEGFEQDAQGNIWAATGSNGLWRWNGSSWRNWPQLGGTATISGVGKDKNGVAYVATWYGPVFKMINDEPVFFADADNIPSRVIGRPNGDIWITNYGGNGTLGTVRHYTANGQLLSRFNTYNSGVGDYFIDRMKRDSHGNMWFMSSEGGLTRMLGSNGAPNAATHWRNWGNHNDGSEPYPWAGNDPMYSVFEDDNGIYWMGGNGIGRWDSATGSFTNFWNWENSNIGTQGIYSIVKRQGTIWAGSGGAGVYWLNGNDWTQVLLSSGGYTFTPNNVKAMTVDTENNLWVASESGLRKFAPGNNSTFTLYDATNSPLPSSALNDVEADPAGGIWIATFAGLVRFDGTNWTIYNPGNTGMPASVIYDVALRQSDGAVAIAGYDYGTGNGGVSVFNGNTWTHYTPANSPMPHYQVNAAEFDGNGNLWASPFSEGVVQIMIGNPPQQLQFVSAVSRKTHGSAGTFDVGLPLSGAPGVECRSSAGNHMLVFTFNNNVISGNAIIDSGVGTVSGPPIFSGSTMSVNLTGVANTQTLTVRLTGVTDEFSQILPDSSVNMNLLIGDTNGNGTVNASDVAQAKSRIGQAVGPTNFRTDVNATGTINATDVALIKSHLGSGVP